MYRSTKTEVRPCLRLLVAIGLAVCLGVADPSYAAESGKILILPFQVTTEDVEYELQSFSRHVDQRLRSTLGSLTEGLSVETEEATASLLKGRAAPSTERVAREIAGKSDADLVIYGFLGRAEDRYRMKGVMWDLHTGRVMVSADLNVANIYELPGVLQVLVKQMVTRLHGRPKLPFYKADHSGSNGRPVSNRRLASLPRDTGPWRSPDIRAALNSIDIGDLDGDKKNEIVFLDKAHITIRRFEDASLHTLSQFSQAPAAYLSAEVEDIDQDGISELIVCYHTPKGLESAIITYSNRVFKVAGKYPNLILRTIKDPSVEGKKVLVGQRTDGDDMFSGEMVLFDVKEGRAVPNGTISLPPGTLLTSYVSGRLGKDSAFLRIILNQDQRLMVFDRDNRLVAALPDRIFGLNRTVRWQAKNGPRNVVFPGRLLVADPNGTGQNELLVIKQSGRGSSVQGLGWDGKQLLEKWKTVETPGLIADFRIRDFKNSGADSFVLILVKPSAFIGLTGPRSVVYAYDIGP
jgi:hypothetical protein